MTALPAAVPAARTGQRSVALRLGLLVAASTVVHGALALTTSAPWIVPDELIYSELAKSIAAGDTPSVRGVESLGYGLGYPLLLAPLWAAFESVPDAYTAARLLNALLLSLAAVPAYLLARRFVRHGAALGVATLTVALPSMAYAGVLMTENAFFVTFLLFALALVRVLERPSAGRQVAALAAIGVAYGVRAQMLALVPAYLTAIVAHRWLERRSGGRVAGLARTYAWSLGALAAGALGLLAVQAARGSSPLSVLGAYRVVASSVDVLEVPWWLALHLADLSLYVAVAPAAAAVVMCVLGLARRAAAPVRLYAAVVPALVLWVVLPVAAFASETDAQRTADAYPGDAAHLFERSIFPLVPLLLVGLAFWIEQGLPRPRRAALAAAVVCGLAPAAIPFDRISDNLNFQAPGLVFWGILPLGGIALAATVGVVGLLLALLWLRVDRRRGYLYVAVATSFALGSLVATGSIRNSSAWAREAASGDDPAWVDRAVGDGAAVDVVWFEPSTAEFADSTQSQRLVWVNEFFNRSIATVYALGARLPYGLPDTRVRAGAGGGLVTASGAPARSVHVLARCRGVVVGTVVAEEPETGAVVVRTDGRVRLASHRPVCPR